MRRLPSALFLALGMLACTALAGCSRSAPAAEEEHQVAPVIVENAEPAEFGEWTELIGATQPLPGHVARVTAPVEGHVLSILTDDKGRPVAEGQHVAKDELIVRLDDRVAKAQRDKLTAMIDELVESRKQADLAYQLASLTVESLTKLNPPGTVETGLPLISKIDLDKARLALQDAESKQRGVTAKDKTLRAELHALEVQLHYYQLRAPIAGVLGPLQVVPGQTLAIGASVADVTDLAEIDVAAFAPPRTAHKLRLNQRAWLAGKDATAPEQSGPEGKVVFIAVQAQPDTGNLLVKVRFSNPQLALRANQVARANVLTQDQRKRLSIAEAALLEDQDPPLVVIAEDVEVHKNKEGEEERLGKAHRVRVRLGVRDRSRHVVEVLRLEDPATNKEIPVEGTLFVVEGGHGLHDGDVVKVGRREKKD